jgi:quinol monooxygenase YgiN
MELYIFGRFHASAGNEQDLADAVTAVIAPTRQEAGCLNIHGFRSIRDPRLFYIHSHWTSEEAFEIHATLPHTERFIERVETLIDHSLDVARTELIG